MTSQANSCTSSIWDQPWPSVAWLQSVSSHVLVSDGSPGRLGWSLYTCVVLWRAVYGTSATEREFLPTTRFLSRRDMTYAVESDVRPNSHIQL